MPELAEALTGESYAAAPASILEGLNEELVLRSIAFAPHTIYAEVWHMAFWQRITLDWIGGVETPFPEKSTDGFPAATEAESWLDLRQRFLADAAKSAAASLDVARLDQSIRCPSRPDQPTRIMSVRDQLISLAAHNAYHLGRIVLLRQLLQTWPPTSGGYTW